MATFSFDTAQPSLVKGLQGYTLDPIFTVGDKIGTYVPPGILDGIGAFSLNDTTVRLYVTHELANTVGYKYTLKNGTQLPGARVSYFDVDKRTFQITDSGLAYDTIINRAGKVVAAPTDLDFAGLNRLCSAALFEANQFGAGIGLADRIFMSGEETRGGTQFALDIKTNTLFAVPWLGRAGWENVTEINTGRADKVAFLIGDDSSTVPLSLYVGDKNALKDGSFLDRNGLAQGKLFVWVADDPTDPSPTEVIEANPSQFNGNNKVLGGKFVEIKYYDPAGVKAVDGPDADTSIQNELGYDALGFATYAQQLKEAADKEAFLFSRLEDVSTNPKDGTQAVFAATGITGTPDVFGTTYRIDIDFNNIDTGDITGKIDILFDGNITKDASLRSPDNLDWADDGKIYINEDRAISAALFGGTTLQEGSIFRIDPSVADPSSTLTRIAQIDRPNPLALPATQTDSAPTDLGNWETSGILDVSTLFGAKPGELFIFDVQAGSLTNGTIITASGSLDTDGVAGASANENLVRGGQLSFLIAPNAKLVQSTSLVGGATSGNDDFFAGVKSGFDGTNDIVFTGAGNDVVDNLGLALASGNRIDTGSGDDTIFLSTNDRAFGGNENDTFEAGNASGYRASGGAGNDTFFLSESTNGRALGGDGDDKFFAGGGGGNLLSGGAGADQFWIFGGSAPSTKNTVLDFVSGTDVIGLIGSGTNFAGLTRSGNDISLGATVLATLTGVDTTTLTAANFAFI